MNDPKKPSPLDALRRRINTGDSEILRLLSERRDLAREVARAKQGAASIRDSKREEELLVRLITEGRERGLDAHFISKVFHAVIEDSLSTQRRLLQQQDGDESSRHLRVAFQGVTGAYSHLAARQHFTQLGDQVNFQGHKSFAEAAEALEQGKVDYCLLPVENTTAGSINEVYDLLLHSQLSIVGEEKLRVDHCLAGLPGADAGRITRVLSHPQALTQCSRYIAGTLGAEPVLYRDTAEAVHRVVEDADAAQAAIASEEAAALGGLAILERNIANQRDNFTRFLVLARKPRSVDTRIPCKTSIVLATAQQSGSLVDALLTFREHALNMVKLESRPILGNPWEEMFYIDFQGNVSDGTVKEALADLTRSCRFLKVLGCYPSTDLPETELPVRVLAESAALADSSEEPAVDATEPPAAKPAGYPLASREHKTADTVIEIGQARIGGPELTLIAGPCSVESAEQIDLCARIAKESGATILRGGVFKPRSSPYSFQGLGMEGLELLVDAGRRYGLPVITEVLSVEDVGPVAERADMLQIGTRNMQNFSLLRRVGQSHRPVMLKRGMMASIEELLMAAEYILAQGNQQVCVCERGIRTFETATRNTLDLSAVPIIKRLSHLPVIVDPSHAAGDRELVPVLAKAGKAAGAQGIMVEFHPEPERAMSDGPQALRPPQFRQLAAALLGASE
jgi:chorismate mutase / prephenate dehydratase